MRRSRLVIALLLVAYLAAPALAAKKPVVDQFEATFISMNAPGAMGSRVNIWIDEYTSDDVTQKLVADLERGQQALLDELTKLQVGRIRIGTSDSYPIAVARQRANDDGSRAVFLVSPRPFVGFEQISATKTKDYPFGVIELKLDATGKGDGQIIGAAQLSFDPADKKLNIASYAVEPGRLSDLKTTTKKKQS